MAERDFDEVLPLWQDSIVETVKAVQQERAGQVFIDTLGQLLASGEQVNISIALVGLTPGVHGVHLHTAGKCDTPDFTTGDYKEGVVAEDDSQVTFEFRTPYIIAATPANDGPWGVYEPGCRNGLVVGGKGDFAVSVSVELST